MKYGRFWMLGLLMLAGCSAASSAQNIPSPIPPATQQAPAPTTPITPQRSPTPTKQPPTPVIPTATPTAAPPTLVPAPQLAGELITQTIYFDLYRQTGGLDPTTVFELAPQIEHAIEQVTARMSTQLAGRVAISFEAPQQGPCAIRGQTFSHERRIHLYYGPDSDPRRVLAIIAHELAHEIQHDYYGWESHQRSDIILLEGQATWASADYARGKDGKPIWSIGAAEALAQGNLLPLESNLEADCRTSTRNTAYTGWASFVDFLIQHYGQELFDQLYRSGRGRDPGSADYFGTYAKDLPALEQEWHSWLAAARY